MGLTNERIKQIALQQSALDASCKVEDFTCGRNVVTVSKENAFGRKYLKQCNKKRFSPGMGIDDSEVLFDCGRNEHVIV